MRAYSGLDWKPESSPVSLFAAYDRHQVNGHAFGYADNSGYNSFNIGVRWTFGAKSADPLAMYLADVFTVTPALAALPALSVPAGFAGGMPVGLQLIGPSLRDVQLLEVAHAFQQATAHHRQLPPL